MEDDTKFSELLTSLLSHLNEDRTKAEVNIGGIAVLSTKNR
jgi:hypothetical protein